MSNSIRFIDLFAGLGGLRLGLEKAAKNLDLAVECVFTSEIKPHAIAAYEMNFPGEQIAGDITQVETGAIPEFDILLAGFPCQPFSSAGKGLGFSDTRGTLFFDIERILAFHEPSAFILENVEGLVHHDKRDKSAAIGNTLQVILGKLTELGYQVSWKVFDASKHGLPQKRKRVYIVGTKTTSVDLTGLPESFRPLRTILEERVEPSLELSGKLAQALLSTYSLNDLKGKQIRDKRGGSNNIHSWDLSLKGPVTPAQSELLRRLLKQRRRKSWAALKGIPWADGMPLTDQEIFTFSSDLYANEAHLHASLEELVKAGYLAFERPKKGDSAPGYNIVVGKLSFEISQILDPDGLTPTLVATDVTRLAVPGENGTIRRLSVREGFRLFGFPDSYKIPEGLKYEKVFDLLGNSVTLNVVEAVAQKVLANFK